MKNHRNGFTMIELIFAVTIFAVFATILLPELNKAIDERDRASFEQLKQHKAKGVVDGTTWDK